jgi:hypothetical protein
VELVEADLNHGVGVSEFPQPTEISDEEPVPRELLAARLRDYHVWIIHNGTEHRPTNQNMTTAMCGVTLDPRGAPKLHPTVGVEHCHECDSAVGLARLRTKRLGRNPKKGKKQSLSGEPSKKQASAPGKKSRPKDRLAEKEKALFGRKMIVPVRFVRGGLPTLGRRR